VNSQIIRERLALSTGRIQCSQIPPVWDVNVIRLRGSFSIATIVAFCIGVRTGRYGARELHATRAIILYDFHSHGIATERVYTLALTWSRLIPRCPSDFTRFLVSTMAANCIIKLNRSRALDMFPCQFSLSRNCPVTEHGSGNVPLEKWDRPSDEYFYLHVRMGFAGN